MKGINKLLFIGVMIGAFLFLVDLFFKYLSGNVMIFDKSTVVSFGYYLLYAIPLTFVNAYFFEYYNKLSLKRYGKYKILLGMLGGISVTMVTLIFIKMFQEMAIDGENFDEYLMGEQKNGLFYITSLIITVIITIIFHAFFFYKELQKRKVTEQKIIAGTASAQFDALKNQLDPHFLFNSLNVLTSLIDENPDAAQKFTTSLSKVYRYVLEQKNKELVTVDEELQFAKTYVSLLKMRFEGSIFFDIPDKATNPDAKVVPLSLQLLLENAVKHNIVDSSKPLHIKIVEQEGYLVVENNLQPKEIIKKSSGVGLSNIQQRYGLLTNREVLIHKTSSSFIVKLPVLTKQISVMQAQENYIEDKRYLKAKEKVEKIKGFYSNLISYIIVIPILAYINYRTTDFPWVIFPALGWGFGVIAHGLDAYGYNPILGRNWEERKIKEFMKKDDL
ncbi:MAG: 2TM domain-containing protein [Flavobacteriaceae bacterium]|jgi:hypothetical protein